MITRTFILAAVAASFLMASPALAIQKKGSGSSKSKDAVQAQNNQSESGEKGRNVTAPDDPKKSSARRPTRETKRDNFIDENDDGINDNITREPAVKVKKKDPPREGPRSKEPEKTDKKRRG